MNCPCPWGIIGSGGMLGSGKALPCQKLHFLWRTRHTSLSFWGPWTARLPPARQLMASPWSSVSGDSDTTLEGDLLSSIHDYFQEHKELGLGHSRFCKRTFRPHLQWEVKSCLSHAKAKLFDAEVDCLSTSSFICPVCWATALTCTKTCSDFALFPCVKMMGGGWGWSWEEPGTTAWWWHWTS